MTRQWNLALPLELDNLMAWGNASTMGINPKSYYRASDGARCWDIGDIWSGLPDFGLLGDHSIKGIVVTPACQLHQRKTEVVTYLPVVTVADFFVTPRAAPMLINELRILGGQLKISFPGTNLEDVKREKLSLPKSARIIKWKDILKSKERGGGGSPGIYDEASDIISLLGYICAGRQQIGKDPMLNKRLKATLGKLLTDNSDGEDTFFLPASLPVLEESVVLLRYPLTIPSEILAKAEDVDDLDWTQTIRSMRRPARLVSFFEEKPGRICTLDFRLTADLITTWMRFFCDFGRPDDSIRKI